MKTIYPNGRTFPDNPKLERFKERFEQSDVNGAWKLTADGCMKRFQIPREEMMLTAIENRQRNLEMTSRADREERQIQATLANFLAKGYKLRQEETIEEFITRCNEFENL